MINKQTSNNQTFKILGFRICLEYLLFVSWNLRLKGVSIAKY